MKFYDSNSNGVIRKIKGLTSLSFLGMYIIFYLCVMTCYATVSVPYNGLIADQTPAAQRGRRFTILVFLHVCIHVIIGKWFNFSLKSLICSLTPGEVSITVISAKLVTMSLDLPWQTVATLLLQHGLVLSYIQALSSS